MAGSPRDKEPHKTLNVRAATWQQVLEHKHWLEKLWGRMITTDEAVSHALCEALEAHKDYGPDINQ